MGYTLLFHKIPNMLLANSFMIGHCCPINSLSLRERVGVRGSISDNCMNSSPLILSFSRREREF